MPTADQLANQLQKFSQRSGWRMQEKRQKLTGELGIAEKRRLRRKLDEQILGAEGTLEKVGRDVQVRARSLGGPVTNAVLNKLTTSARAPIIQQIRDLTRGSQVAGAGLRDLQDELKLRLGIFGRSQDVVRDALKTRLGLAAGREARVAARGGGTPFGDIQAFIDALDALPVGGLSMRLSRRGLSRARDLFNR